MTPVRLAGRRPGHRRSQSGRRGARAEAQSWRRARRPCPSRRRGQGAPGGRSTSRRAWSGLRDRALIGTLLTYTFAPRSARRSACAIEDYFADGKRWRLRLNEKGGKVHEMPAHHNLEAYLDAYIFWSPRCSSGSDACPIAFIFGKCYF